MKINEKEYEASRVAFSYIQRLLTRMYDQRIIEKPYENPNQSYKIAVGRAHTAISYMVRNN